MVEKAYQKGEKNCNICNYYEMFFRQEEGGKDSYKCECAVCGKFYQAGSLFTLETQPDESWKISSWIRNENRKGKIPVLHTNSFDEIINDFEQLNPGQLLDHALVVIAEKTDDLLTGAELYPAVDYPIFKTRNNRNVIWILQQLDGLGLIEAKISSEISYAKLNARGWEKISELSRILKESEQVFVAMWFDPSMNELYENGIKSAIESEEVGYNSFRIDRKDHNNKIDDEIIKEIRRSRFLVADFTEDRGGVYYEAGFAKGLGLEVIWTCRKDKIDEVHFDTRQYPHLLWTDAENLKKQLIDKILALNM